MNMEKIMSLTNADVKELSNIDLIISSSPYPEDIITSIKLSKKYNIPVICYFHHITPSLFMHPFRRGIFRVLLNRVWYYYSMHLVKKNKLAIFLDQPQTFKNKKIKVYENLSAVNVPEMPVSKKEYDICYIGRLNKPKGIFDLINVVRILKDKKIYVKVAVIGFGDSKVKNKISRILNKYKISKNFIFFGFVSNEEKYNILNKSKIFVSLSYEEGWSLAVMEAATLKIPVVAYSQDAYSYLNNNYWQVKIGNINEVSSIIAKLLLEGINKSKTEEAYINVKHYNYNDIALQQIEYFNEFIKDKQR
jgi:glycosyltransferase involved in cell wall biosynthesis